jgi:hypothetical protein
MCDFSFVRRSARLPLDPRAACILSGEIETPPPVFSHWRRARQRLIEVSAQLTDVILFTQCRGRLCRSQVNLFI